MPDSPKTPHSSFRLPDDTRRQLSDIAKAMSVTQTDAIKKSVAAMAAAVVKSPELNRSMERAAAQLREVIRGVDTSAYDKVAQAMAQTTTASTIQRGAEDACEEASDTGDVVSKTPSIDVTALDRRLCPLGYGHTGHAWELTGPYPVKAGLHFCVGQPFSWGYDPNDD